MPGPSERNNKSREKIIARGRQLPNPQAGGSDFEGEIAAAAKAAQELIEKHAIREAELHCGPCGGSGQVRSADGYTNVSCPTCSGKGAVQEEEAYGRGSTFTAATRLSQWESGLANAVKGVVGTVQWYHQSNCARKDDSGVILKGSQRATKVTYYGPAEDVAVAIEMFSDIAQTIVTMALLKWNGAFWGPGLSYCRGFVSSLASEVSQRNTAASVSERQGISTALAVRTREIMSAKRRKGTLWLRECGVRLAAPLSQRRMPTMTDEGVEAYSEGRDDGRAHGMSVTRKAKLGAQAALPTRKGQ